MVLNSVFRMDIASIRQLLMCRQIWANAATWANCPLAGASELASYGAGLAALVPTTVGRMQPAEEGNRLIDTFNTLVPLEGTEQQDL